MYLKHLPKVQKFVYKIIIPASKPTKSKSKSIKPTKNQFKPKKISAVKQPSLQ